ncbi:ubiquinol-cytochrome c reductase iron-sulfur subunit [Rhodococcus sp. HNM0563]|uniref:cytochrome bc1 complex Rieske iron-sulfur subunit n=1 Tax=unclassified Rhodococcus (in: high G+C Gram-positive bacteria) TaxID=192944 RepID=UPI00146CB214|nr:MULTISPECIES: ubiquinol-cytochrome c reductase iron-sulfur subunit [unclassified Rhodococcus (in: high G+C Gram-positive bacteria)]MCK0092938.1 ubiquinol-cytochrome c reductase iron-sulfur subunit [Rhodococcus sp. F64268]NLU61158.1 ubiquinol-cytochrome c reductase iron-sulfur subunit [Rhodococcus sp. HNM0563]
MSSGDTPNKHSIENLDQMSRDDLVELGTNLDGVDVAFRKDRWPVEGTRAEKRAERNVAAWFILAGIAGLAFIGIYLFWPWEYQSIDDPQYGWYNLYTPLLGLTLGLSILGVGVGAVQFTKKFIPEEVSIQDRHDGPSAEVDRKTIVAELTDSLETSTFTRRKLVKRTAIFGGGALGVGLIMPLGGLIKNPWAEGDDSSLWVSGWTPRYQGETIYLRRDTGRPQDIVLVRPEDLDAGGMETVFPFREADRGDDHALLDGLRGIRNAVMLIRLRTDDAERAIKRKGQESFNYGDYFAFSKICTHLGCPTSLYEQQTNRILCPCHQSQFDALEYGKPIFGPAARALPQLPITVNEEGFLVANGDFIEALGPAFWERRP